MQPQYQGITIDTLVKRYLFKIQFYSSSLDPNIPTEVLFTEWIPDPVPLTSAACNTITTNQMEFTHLTCTFTTPPIDLCANGHVHLFRLEFTGAAWDTTLGYLDTTLYEDYPCLMYGPNLSAVPYIKCDLLTYRTGPYATGGLNGNFINVYGYALLPGSSSLTL